MDHASRKKELRSTLLARRKALSEGEIAAHSHKVFERWRNRFTLKSVCYFHLFQTIPRTRELDTSLFSEYAWSRFSHVRVVVPVVPKGSRDLEHILVDPQTNFVETAWGIPEPQPPHRRVFPMQMDMVLVPLLGFDDEGHRLGYGGGYYDRFLSLCRPKCLKIGLGLELGHQTEALPRHDGDVPLDFIITEEEVYRFC